MDRKHYLHLITETYFETKNPVASEPAEPMFDLQKKLFKQILIRKQKVAEREDFITRDEFLLQCELALDHLKEYVSLQSFFEINRLHEKKESTRTFWFDENGSTQNIPESVVKDIMDRTQIEIDNFDQDSFLVDLSGLNPAICGKLCSYEIEFLEDIFKNFNIEIDHIYEPEALDLSETSAIQKIIYLKELGIIDMLQKEPCFMSSVNNLATVLSAITGEKVGTLQPILNSMLNKSNAQKNNPYKSTSTVNKVKAQLTNFGVILK
jgi:hypothetical protein